MKSNPAMTEPWWSDRGSYGWETVPFALLLGDRWSEEQTLEAPRQNDQSSTGLSNRPPRAHIACRWRRYLATRRPRAAEGDAGHRFSEQRGPRRACTAFGRVPPRAGRNRLRRGTKRGDRIPLGRGAV